MNKHSHKIIKPENDLGLGNKVADHGPTRFINKDGSFNITRSGIPYLRLQNIYHDLITMSWLRFSAVALGYYLVVNTLFTCMYLLTGVHHLAGVEAYTLSDKFYEAFFFSAQTLTTVGYGRVSPEGLPANIIAALESLIGVLAFAIATGICYGRFAKPNARIQFSKNILIAPYQDITALQFKICNIRDNQLIEIEVMVTYSYLTNANGKFIRKYVSLPLERDKVNFFPLPWVLVHPINEESPLWGVDAQTLTTLDAEVMVLIKAFDDTFAQNVHVRSSYKHDEFVFGGKFKINFDKVTQGKMLIELDKIDDYDIVPLASTLPLPEEELATENNTL
ncbi:MAG: hypothetical protein RL711_716 [Bacteroidota bacterium]